MQERRRWPLILAAAGLAVLFAAWWAFMALLYGLGTCGEDSDITVEEYDRLCGPGGSIGDGMIWIGSAATVAVLVLGAIATVRRSWWPVSVLAILLLGLGFSATGLA